MAIYLVSVFDNNSWRKLEQSRIEASNIGLASYRAFKKFKAGFKGKRINDITIKSQLLTTGIILKNNQ